MIPFAQLIEKDLRDAEFAWAVLPGQPHKLVYDAMAPIRMSAQGTKAHLIKIVHIHVQNEAEFQELEQMVENVKQIRL